MEKQCAGSQGLREWLRENPHALWALCLIPILICYFVPEWLVHTDYHPTQIALDASIPFAPFFVYFYLLWFALLAGMGLWLLLCDGSGFREYMLFLAVSFFACAVFYLCWPNGQDLRPAEMEVDSLSTWILSRLYAFDTNTNVLPSLHVIGSVGAAFAALRTPTIRSRGVKAAVLMIAVLVSASTVFVKQHAILDVAAGLVTGIALYLLTALVCRKFFR